MSHPLFGLTVVHKKKSCAFCRGHMHKDDLQFSERQCSGLVSWCLSCGLLRLEEIQKLVKSVRDHIDAEIKLNPDKYVRTAITAKGGS